MTEPHSDGPKQPTENRRPIVVDEALAYLKQVALSQRAMEVTSPWIQEGPQPTVGVQTQVLEEEVKTLRSEVLLRGTEFPMERGRTIYRLAHGPTEVFSSRPQDDRRLTKGRVFWVINHGNKGEPDILFDYHVDHDGNKFGLVVDYGPQENLDSNESLKYESGKQKRDEMERPEYEVSSYILGEAIKRIGQRRFK